MLAYTVLCRATKVSLSFSCGSRPALRAPLLRFVYEEVGERVEVDVREDVEMPSSLAVVFFYHLLGLQDDSDDIFSKSFCHVPTPLPDKCSYAVVSTNPPPPPLLPPPVIAAIAIIAIYTRYSGRGTWNSGFLATEAGTFGRFVGDALITAMGVMTLSSLNILLFLPSMVLVGVMILIFLRVYPFLQGE